MVFAVHTTVNYMYVLVILWFWYSPVTITCGSKWNTSLRLLDNVSVLKSLFHWSDSPFWLILWVCIWYKNSKLAVSWHHIYVVRDLASLLLRNLGILSWFCLISWNSSGFDFGTRVQLSNFYTLEYFKNVSNVCLVGRGA